MSQQAKRLTTPNQTNNTVTIHINVLLDSLSNPVIGLLIIKHNPNKILTLSDIREYIKSQFDEHQLQTIGGANTFKFLTICTQTLSTTTPISRKQEQFININDISISDTDTNPDTNENEYKHNSHRHKNRIKRHYSLDESFDTYHNSKSIGRSLPTHLTVPTTNKTLSKPNKSVENTHIIYYSIIVRANIQIDIKCNDLNLPLPPTIPSLNTSMSIFERSHITTLMETETEHSNSNISLSHSLSLSQSSEPPSIDDISEDYALKIKTTQLERQFGGKLPRIRESKFVHTLAKPDHIQMTNILAHALVENDDIPLIVKKTSSYPILPTTTQLQSHISYNNEICNEGNVNNINEISYNETNNMFNEIISYMPLNDMNKPLIKEDSDDDIKDSSCRFTVIGSRQFDNNNQKQEQKTWVFYDPSELILGLQGVHHSEKAPIWMDLVCDHNTFMMISEHIRPKIHQLSIEDCVTFECREKLELFDDYLFICIHTSIDERLYIIVFKTIIITYHNIYDDNNNINNGYNATDIIITETINQLEKRHKKYKSYYISPGWITHSIIDIIVNKMRPEIECRVSEVNNIEYLIFTLTDLSHNELLHRLQNSRNKLVIYRSKLWPKSTITNNLINTEWRGFLNDVPQQYWNDINDHVTRMVDLLNIGQNSLESCQKIFIAKISLEMANQSNLLTDSASKLSVFGSVFLPLAYIAGLWGMNCKVPFQYEGPDSEDIWGDSHYGFCIIATLMICMAVITYKFSMKVV